jgi:multiple sugar transport system substrate-binding protein
MDMTRDPIDRRRFLKRAGAVGGGLVAGPSLLQLLEACGGGTSTQKAPASVNWNKGGEIHLLSNQNFVPAGDQKQQELMTRWASRHKGWKAVLEPLEAENFQTKVASVVQAQTGPDIIEMQFNWPWLYERLCVDVGDIVGRLQKSHGAFYKAAAESNQVDGTWRAVPFSYIAYAWPYRRDLWTQVGKPGFVSTYKDLLTYGKQVLQKTGFPIGIALGHAFGDAGNMWNQLLWCYGASTVDKAGKQVTLDSDKTREAVDWAIEMWNSGALSHKTLSWTDTNNNLAYNGKQISATTNASSIYTNLLPGHHNADPALSSATAVAPALAGPKGRYAVQASQSNSVMTWSSNPGAAKDLIEFLMQKENYLEWMTAGNGYTQYPGPFLDDAPLWKNSPALKAYNDSVKFGLWPGWPGPPNRASAEVDNKYILVDMFAQAVQRPRDAKSIIKAAAQQIDTIYSRPG